MKHIPFEHKICLFCRRELFHTTTNFNCESDKCVVSGLIKYWINDYDTCINQNLRFKKFMIRNMYYPYDSKLNITEIKSYNTYDLLITLPFLTIDRATDLDKLEQKINKIIVFG